MPLIYANDLFINLLRWHVIKLVFYVFRFKYLCNVPN